MPRKASGFHRMTRLPLDSLEVRFRGGRGIQEFCVNQPAAASVTRSAPIPIQSLRLLWRGGSSVNANGSGSAVGLTGVAGVAKGGGGSGSETSTGPAARGAARDAEK